jgi:hypothetical protein
MKCTFIWFVFFPIKHQKPAVVFPTTGFLTVSFFIYFMILTFKTPSIFSISFAISALTEASVSKTV